MKWQPMDEAPKQPLNEIGEGPRILLRVDKEIMLGFWLTADDDGASCWWVQGSATGNVSPSAWFPLPSDEATPSPEHVPFAAAWERGTQFGSAWGKWIAAIDWDSMSDAQRSSARNSFEAGWKASDTRIYDTDRPAAPAPLSPTTTRNLACIKLHLEIAEVSKRTQALMPSIVNFKDALRRLAEVEAALAEYDAAGKEKST